MAEETIFVVAALESSAPGSLSLEWQGSTQCHGVNGWSFAVPLICPPDAVEVSVSQEASVKSGGGTMFPCGDEYCVSDSRASGRATQVLACSCKMTRDRESYAARMVRTDRGRGSQVSSFCDVRQGNGIQCEFSV